MASFDCIALTLVLAAGPNGPFFSEASVRGPVNLASLEVSMEDRERAAVAAQ